MADHPVLYLLYHRRLLLQHETLYESWCFHVDGHASATLGLKDGPMCGVVLKYTIEGDEIVIWNHNDTVSRRWSNLALDGSMLELMSNGVAMKFRVEG